MLNDSSTKDTSIKRTSLLVPMMSVIEGFQCMIIILISFLQDVPDAPFNLSSVNILSKTVTLNWSKPNDNNSPILGYFVFYINPSFLNGTEIVLETEGAKEEIQVNNLHPGTNYTFHVIAFNEEGNSTSQTIGYHVTTLDEGMITH